MKRTTRILIPALACAVALASCKKNESTSDLPTTYRIEGVTDLEFEPIPNSSNPFKQISLNITNLSKFQEYVKLSLEGVPDGMVAKIATPGGYTSFQTFVSFTDTSVLPGTYPIKLVCESDKTGKKSYNMTFTVKPYPDPIPALLGVYSGSSMCVGGSYKDTVVSYSEANSIMFKNFDGQSADIYAKVDPKTLNVTIPVQNANGLAYSGTGHVSFSTTPGYPNNISLNYTTFDGIDSFHCSTSLYK